MKTLARDLERRLDEAGFDGVVVAKRDGRELLRAGRLDHSL